VRTSWLRRGAVTRIRWRIWAGRCLFDLCVVARCSDSET
jgi:hypothetical protein